MNESWVVSAYPARLVISSFIFLLRFAPHSCLNDKCLSFYCKNQVCVTRHDAQLETTKKEWQRRRRILEWNSDRSTSFQLLFSSIFFLCLCYVICGMNDFIEYLENISWLHSSIPSRHSQAIFINSQTAKFLVIYSQAEDFDTRIDRRKLINWTFVFRGDRQRLNKLFSIIGASGISWFGSSSSMVFNTLHILKREEPIESQVVSGTKVELENPHQPWETNWI